MSFFGGIKKIIKPLVDVPKWIGYRQLVKTNRLLFSFVKKFFIPDQTKTQESFQTALDRLKLTEVDLGQRMKEFSRLMWIWIFLFLISISYSIHLLRQNSLRGFFPCLGVSIIILTQVFRYHFWIFQIKQRRLGCSFRDWLAAQLTIGKKKQ
ncbi:MAG: type IVB secretion system protein IcmV [Rickettsiella sp.]|nr:type IVB secretion system protein IcmV [Rickettsiella sp.]